MDPPDLDFRSGSESHPDSFACIEEALIKAYLHTKGHTEQSLDDLPPPLAQDLRIEASVYASCRLAEMDAFCKMLEYLST